MGRFDFDLTVIADSVLFIESKEKTFTLSNNRVVFNNGSCYFLGCTLKIKDKKYEIVSHPEVGHIGSGKWYKVIFSVKKL